MIVFRKQEKLLNTRERLISIRKIIQNLDCGKPDHQAVVELLIEFAELESAVTDVFCMERDDLHELLSPLRELSILNGLLLYHSWVGKAESLPLTIKRIQNLFEKIMNLDLPKSICIRVSEGFIHYGIFPETYARAAERFHCNTQPSRVVCIGIRSIGTALSAVVGSVLQELGSKIDSLTLRPRGHPFDRKILLSDKLEFFLKSLSDKNAYYLVIDEGPGLSGTSLCATAQKLSELGIEDSRIVLFPCWEPDGEDFVSEIAKKRWGLHAKYSTTFEEVWLNSDKLNSVLPSPNIQDISAGNWRSILFQETAQSPAVHHHHEQRKYLSVENGHRWLVKFAGLGRYGRIKRDRLATLASTGTVPPPVGFAHGFLVTPFHNGRPFLPGSVIRKDFIHTIADYLAFIHHSFSNGERVSSDEMLQMIRTNIHEGLGEEWVRRIDTMDFRRCFDDSIPVQIDGRMFPHEWICTENGYIKADSVDHHIDQFFPRTQDSAWDLAGTCIEFGFDRNQKDYLIDRFQSLTKDRYIRWKLPFYSIAYLAFRLGYSSLCSESLGTSEDGIKFTRMSERYRTSLKRLILLHT